MQPITPDVDIIDELNKRINDDQPLFKLGSSGFFTVKTRAGKYFTKSFVGDEHLNLTSAYVGKKDLIYVLKPTFATPEYAFAELTSKQAALYLVDFISYIEEAQNDQYDNFVDRVRRSIDPALDAMAAARERRALAAKETIEKERDRIIKSSFPHYRSW